MIRGLHLLVGVIVFQKPTLLLLIDILVITMGVKSRWHSVITDKHPTTVFLNSSLSWRTMEIIQALCLFVCDVMMFGTIISNTTDMHIFFSHFDYICLLLSFCLFDAPAYKRFSKCVFFGFQFVLHKFSSTF